MRMIAVPSGLSELVSQVREAVNGVVIRKEYDTKHSYNTTNWFPKEWQQPTRTFFGGSFYCHGISGSASPQALFRFGDLCEESKPLSWQPTFERLIFGLLAATGDLKQTQAISEIQEICDSTVQEDSKQCRFIDVRDGIRFDQFT